MESVQETFLCPLKSGCKTVGPLDQIGGPDMLSQAIQ